MSILKIRMFAEFVLAWDHVPMPPISGATARSLLAYLITYRSQSHTRDLLAGNFWPDLPDQTARRRLSQAIWKITSSFDPYSILQIKGDTIQFTPDLDTWIDREELIYCYTQSRGNNQQVIENDERCIENYRGDFLAGYYDEWILSERERLRNMYLGVLERLINNYKLRNNFEQALIHARSLAAEDPWSETGHREVIRLCYILNRPVEVNRQYQICRQMLSELGVEPSPETELLMVEISRKTNISISPWFPVATYNSPAPMLERPDHLPLVGRQSELSWLISQAEAAAHGEGGLILLYGEAGIGKTRLLQELARNVQWRGIHTAWGWCYDLAGPQAYQPLVEIFRSNLSVLNDISLEPLWRSELARFLPELATDEVPTQLKPEEEQNRLIEAIARGFQALSQASPYLIIFEDAQWMDPASLASIRYLLPRLANMSVMIIFSCRETELSGQQAEAFAGLVNTHTPRELEINRFNLQETGELVQRCLDLDQPPAGFITRLHSETAGNPFFITEILRTLLDEGLLFRDKQGKWSTPWDESSADYSSMPLPRGIIQSIERRLNYLPAPIREAINLAAVIGRDISYDVWHRAGNLSEPELLAAADELCKRGLLHHGVHMNENPGYDYAFSHDLIRRVTHDHLAPAQLRYYHQRVAEALSFLTPGNSEALAYHWTGAKVWDRALEYHKQAGQRAAAVYANSEAVEHYISALDALDRLSTSDYILQSYEIRLALEKIYALQGARQLQSQELATLAQFADTLDDDRYRAEVALRGARLAEIISDFPTAIASACQAVDLARSAKDITLETESLWMWGWVLLLQGDHLLARPRFEQALKLAHSHAMRSLESDGLHGLGTICLVTGEYNQARNYFQQVLDISHKVDIRSRAGRSLANLGYIATIQGDHIASKQYNDQALHIHQEIGDQRGISIAIQNLADELLAEGNFNAAKNYYEESLATQKSIQATQNIGVTLRGLGLLHDQLGNYVQAKKYYEEALAVSKFSGVRWYQGQAFAYLSLLHHHLGDNQTARNLGQEGLIIAQEINDRLAQGWLFDTLGHALFELGELEQAVEAYQQALILRRELNEIHKTSESLAGLARVALKRRQYSIAIDYVENILNLQKTRSLNGTNEPFRIPLTCFHVLEACHDPRAYQILANTYEQLIAFKANIQDDSLEYSFLNNVTTHREIIDAYHKQQSSLSQGQIQLDLPRADAPVGRPLREDEFTCVVWTISSPEDEAISNKAMRRRHRLLRLIQEAHTQGASPSIKHVADALGVSRRTVERDLKVLHQDKSQLPPTRGKMSH